MFCKNCGTKCDDFAASCPSCGTVLNPVISRPVTGQSTPMAGQPTPVVGQPTPVAGQPTPTPGYSAPPVYHPPYTPAGSSAPLPAKGLGIAGMVLGIVSLFFVCFCYVTFFAVFSVFGSIASIILCALANSKANAIGKSNGMAKAGMICSCIALGILTLIFMIAVLFLGSLFYYI